MIGNFIRSFLQKTKKVVTLPTLRTSSDEFLLKKTDFGIVRVEFATVQKIAERALESVAGIKESELSVEKFTDANPFKIRLNASLVEGYSAPRISEAADKAINGAFKEFLRLEFYVPVDVKVKQIAQVETKRRRVR